MFRRVLLCVAALIVGASVAQAQGTAMPEVCATAEGIKLDVLEKRRDALQRDIASKGGEVKPDAGIRERLASRGLVKSQEDLLEVMFQIECVRRTAAPPVVSRRAVAKRDFGAAPPPPPAAGAPAPSPVQAGGIIEITTYYATNRKQSGTIAEPVKLYGSTADAGLNYGRATVTIPPGHMPGALEMPTLWKLEREPDATKHFTLKAAVPLSADAARKEMGDRLANSPSKALLVFVHGYNVGFAEAALRTAQLAHDLKFPGMPFFYSWPSAGLVRAYLQDEETARLSEFVFEQLLDDLMQLPVSAVYIVAHSMGNRIVGHGLQSRVDKGKDTKRVRELLLAAPDINVDIFRTIIAPKLAAMQGTRTTVYASSSDLALRASKIVHGFRRVGETNGGVFTYPGFETIDASTASPALRSYGHSYLMDSSSVLGDIGSLIARRASAQGRGLSQAGAAPDNYWRLP